MSIKKYFFSLWLIISLASASTILHAQESGWYLGAGGGLSKVDVNQNLWSDNSVSDASLETTGFAYQIYAGYRLHDNFALEISYLQPADTVFKGVSNGSITIWLPGNIQGDTHVAGTAFSYLLNRKLTFASRQAVGIGFVKYVLALSVGLGLNAAIVAGLLALGAHYLIAQPIATGLVLFWNFGASRLLVFRD